MADSPTNCPFCNDTILIPEEFLDSEVECPNCHKQFVIPKVEEDVAEDSDASGVGAFNCPLCGIQNMIPDNFAGKILCCGCRKEIEVINEDFIPCPHCGGSISKKDTTCMYCQRSPLDPPQPKRPVAPMPKVANPGAQTVKFPTQVGIVTNANDKGDREDVFVLRAMQSLKVVNLVLSSIALLICGGGMVVCILEEDYFLVGSFFGGVLASFYIFVIVHLLLCWIRGLYKNVLLTRLAAEKKSGSF